MTADRKTAEECNHWWLDFNEGKRCSRCGMVVGARFYSKNGEATRIVAEAFPTPAPVGVEEIEGVLWICIKEFASNRREMGWLETEAELAARALLARLKDAPDDAGEPVKRDVGFDPKTQASASLKDAPAAATWKPENPGGFDLRPEPMSEKTVYGRDGCPAPPAIGVGDMEPVAWRVRDFADGWILFDSVLAAEGYSRSHGATLEALCPASALASLTEKLAAEVHECEGHIHNNANLILEKRAAEAERDAAIKERDSARATTDICYRTLKDTQAERDAAMAGITEARLILAGSDIGSLPNDMPLSRIAESRMHERDAAIGAGDVAGLIETLEETAAKLGKVGDYPVTCNILRKAASALASLTAENAQLRAGFAQSEEVAGKMRGHWLDRAEQAEAERDAARVAADKLVGDLTAVVAALRHTAETFMAERDAAHAAYNHMQSEMRNKITPLLDRLTAERDAALATVAAWANVFGTIEAHILDRIAMKDPASPETYLSIIRCDIGHLPKEAEQIYAATQYRWQSAEQQRDAALAELTEKDEALGRLIRTCERAQETRDAALAKAGRLRDAMAEVADVVEYIEAGDLYMSDGETLTRDFIEAALAKTQEPG